MGALRRLTWMTLWSTLALLALGNVVTTTGSGLGCGDHWPSCNGELIPDLSNPQVVFEFGHRVLAALVGLLTLLTALAAWRLPGDARSTALRTTSLIALVLLVIQILLGAITVRAELPPPVVIVHLGVSMAFFATLVALAHLAAEGRWARLSVGGQPSTRFHRLALWTAAAVYLQILLGAYVRHSGAGLACPDVPLCQGQLLPPPYALAHIHFSHRVFAVVVATLAMTLAARARRHHLPHPVLRLARWAAALVVVQIGLGMMSVVTRLSPLWTTLHLVTAAGLLALSVTLALQTRRASLEGVPAPEGVPS